MGSLAQRLGRELVEGQIGKPQKCKFCDNPATKAFIWADGRAYIPSCPQCEKKARHCIEVKNKDSVTAIRPIPQAKQ